MVPQGMIRTSDGVLTQAPAWAMEFHRKDYLREAYDAQSQLATEPPPQRLEFRGDNIQADVVLKGEHDVIFQIYIGTKDAPAPLLPDVEVVMFRVILDHFGTTDRFEGDEVSELRSYAVKAKGLRGIPTYREEFHVAGFLHLLDATIGELE